MSLTLIYAILTASSIAMSIYKGKGFKGILLSLIAPYLMLPVYIFSASSRSPEEVFANDVLKAQRRSKRASLRSQRQNARLQSLSIDLKQLPDGPSPRRLRLEDTIDRVSTRAAYLDARAEALRRVTEVQNQRLLNRRANRPDSIELLEAEKEALRKIAEAKALKRHLKIEKKLNQASDPTSDSVSASASALAAARDPAHEATAQVTNAHVARAQEKPLIARIITSPTGSPIYQVSSSDLTPELYEALSASLTRTHTERGFKLIATSQTRDQIMSRDHRSGTMRYDDSSSEISVAFGVKSQSEGGNSSLELTRLRPCSQTEKYINDFIEIAQNDGQRKQYKDSISLHYHPEGVLSIDYNGLTLASATVYDDPLGRSHLICNHSSEAAFADFLRSKGVDLDALLSASTPREWLRSAADIQYTIEQHKEDYLVCTEAPRRIIEQTQKESKARSKGRSMGL